MSDNAVLRLRARLARHAPRPQPRAALSRCLLPHKTVCRDPAAATSAQSVFSVMFDTEPMKPSNTGRLIADGNPAFWCRKTADYQPMVVFPGAYAMPIAVPDHATHRRQAPLFIMLDGTDRSAQNVSQKSVAG